MHKTVSALLITLAVAGCSTKANPLNWFGGSTAAAPVAAPVEANTNPLLPERRSGLFSSRQEEVVFSGQQLDSVSSLVVERVPGGAIIRVAGLTARQGVYAVQLTPATEDEEPVDGILTYRLEGLQGPGANAGTSPASREVVVARKVTNQRLSGVRTIRVEARSNALQSRR